MIKKPAEMINETNKFRVLIAGYPGIGKTTLGLSAPKPLLIDVDFGINRVHNFKQVFCSGELGEDFDNRFAEMEKQQLAMATALNNLLRGQYMIYDLPETRLEENTISYGNGDEETYLLKIYKSDQVLLQLRSTLPNQSF